MKKGFTLIELLAVIVILAIIALIATPIVLNIIAKARENSDLRSAEMYLDAVKMSVANSSLEEIIILDGTYNILEDGDLCLEYNGTTCSKRLKVEVDGQVPSTGSTITVTDGTITHTSLKYNNKIIAKNKKGDLLYKNKACMVYSGDGTKVGDEIECAGEYFYVINNDNETISMLSKYNLDVGNYNTSSTDVLLAEIQNPTGIQNEKAKGAILKKEKGEYVLNESGNPIFDFENFYGMIEFSGSEYWSSSVSSYPSYVYNESSNLYTHVNNYETYLKNKGVSSATATLMSYEQAVSLGCDEETGACVSEILGQEFGGTAPEWVYSTSYWLGSAYSSDVLGMQSTGFLGLIPPSNGVFGVRPVVTISVSEI